MAVGIFNRFDLAPVDGSDCGEYRIVFARRGFVAGERLNRNLVIFEANLRNPHPERGLNGCVRIAEFWRGLSSDSDVQSRARKLHDFYFEGLPGFLPVVHPSNYGARTDRKGQIRSNQFLQTKWMMREFKLAPGACSEGKACEIMPTTDKTTPPASLFSGSDATPWRFSRSSSRSLGC